MDWSCVTSAASRFPSCRRRSIISHERDCAGRAGEADAAAAAVASCASALARVRRGVVACRARHDRHAARDSARFPAVASRERRCLRGGRDRASGRRRLGRFADRRCAACTRSWQYRDRRDRRLPDRAVLHRTLARADRVRVPAVPPVRHLQAAADPRHRRAHEKRHRRDGRRPRRGGLRAGRVRGSFARDRMAAVAMPGPAEHDLARRIEEAGLNLMHTRRQLFYDGWLLFLLAGKAKRGRSVTAHFGSTLPLPEKIAHCERLYARHGLPALFRITPFAQPAHLDAGLAARGYVEFDRTLVQVATLASPPTPHGNDDVDVDVPMIDAFVEAVGELRDSPASQRIAHLERLAQSPLDVHPVVAQRGGRPVAAGLLSIDGSLAGIFDVVTTTGMQGQGVGTAVVCALLTRAWERGVRRVFMQVTQDNAPAVALYGKFGFATLYAYHYRARPDECH